MASSGAGSVRASALVAESCVISAPGQRLDPVGRPGRGRKLLKTSHGGGLHPGRDGGILHRACEHAEGRLVASGPAERAIRGHARLGVVRAFGDLRGKVREGAQQWCGGRCLRQGRDRHQQLTQVPRPSGRQLPDGVRQTIGDEQRSVSAPPHQQR